MPAALKLTGQLNVEALGRAFGELFRRHESLRTTFEGRDGQPVQHVGPAHETSLVVVDAGALPGDELRRLVVQEARQPFNLVRGPLVRVRLLRLSGEEHVLLLTMHHIVSDGWSMGVLVREMAGLYQAFVEGKPSPLPELTIQYADYAKWQREWLSGARLEEELSHWRKRMEGAPALLALPTDRPRPAVQSYRGAQARLLLPKRLAEALQALSRREGVTLFMTLLAGFEVVLSRYSGQGDVVVGTDIANRNHAETEGLLGFFVNQLVMRNQLSGGMTVRELLAKVRETALEAYAHQDLPFEELVKALNPERSMGHAPLFQVKLVLQNAPVSSVGLPGLSIHALDSEGVAAKFDLTLAFNETPEGLSGFWEYATDLFDAATIERMGVHLGRVLEGMAAEPGRKLEELSLLGEGERRQLLEEWSRTGERVVEEQRAHRRFEAVAARAPDAVAVRHGGESLSYAELNQRANRLAHRLRTLGVGPEVRVGLCVERGFERVVGALAILKAGGAYVPLEASYPAERLGYMLRDAGAPVLVTEAKLADELPSQGEQLVCVDEQAERELLSRQPETNLAVEVAAENAAYVIYTSGSTGQPKGTVLTHGGLCNTALAAMEALEVTAESRVLQFAAFGFDASVWEMFSALLSGARLCLVPEEAAVPGEALHGLMAREGVTTVTLTPSVLGQLSEEGLPALTVVTAAGEACPPELAKRWSKGRRFINAYGPTEVTVCATLKRDVLAEIQALGTNLLTVTNGQTFGGAPPSCPRRRLA